MTLVLFNPHAQGGRAARRIPALHAWLAAHAPDVQLAAPEALQDSVALLQSLPEGSRVVVVGGDGTLNCWLPTLLARRLTVGLLPMGSGNDSARAWGVYGLPWAQALALALQNRTIAAAGLETPPNVKQLVSTKLDSVFTAGSQPTHVRVSAPLHDPRGTGWTAFYLVSMAMLPISGLIFVGWWCFLLYFASWGRRWAFAAIVFLAALAVAGVALGGARVAPGHGEGRTRRPRSIVRRRPEDGILTTGGR